MRRRWLAAAMLLASAAASAETLYVSDRQYVAARSAPTEASAPVKTLETGEALEVLERQGGYVRVRDARAAEAWVEAAALSPQPPAAVQLKAVRAELERTRAQLVNAQTQLDQNRAAGAPPAPPHKELSDTRAQLTVAQNELAQARAALTEAREHAARRPASAASATGDVNGSYTWIWLVLAFAMLVVGFVGGIVWVRESIRRRMGGLYLRI